MPPIASKDTTKVNVEMESYQYAFAACHRGLYTTNGWEWRLACRCLQCILRQDDITIAVVMTSSAPSRVNGFVRTQYSFCRNWQRDDVTVMNRAQISGFRRSRSQNILRGIDASDSASFEVSHTEWRQHASRWSREQDNAPVSCHIVISSAWLQAWAVHRIFENNFNSLCSNAFANFMLPYFTLAEMESEGEMVRERERERGMGEMQVRTTFYSQRGKQYNCLNFILSDESMLSPYETNFLPFFFYQ